MDLYTNGTKAHKIGLERIDVKPKEFNKRLKDLAEVTNLDEGKLDTKGQTDYPQQVKRIHSTPRLCDMDCGKIVTDQIVQLQYRQDVGSWIKLCKVCGQYQNPITKEYTTLHELNQFYRHIFIQENK